MALISLLGITKQYDYKMIVKEVNFSILEGEKIALVGKNGSGKSTLLKIITQEIEPDSGERIAQNGIKILSLPQNLVFDPLLSVRQVCEESLKELKEAHKRLEFINNQMSVHQQNEHLLNALENQANKEILEEQGKLIAFIESHNGWDIQHKVTEILQKFELLELADRLANTLSGGEQKRLAISVLLLKKADIFILDEPTNHLDVQMVEFLEEMISKITSSVVFISHDRYFIENLADRVVEIDGGNVTSFTGGYSNYLRKKEELLSSLVKEHTHLLKLLKSEEEWLNKGTQARRKRNEGRKARVFKMRQTAKSNPGLIHKMKLEIQREQKHFNRKESENNKKMLFECEKISKKIEEKLLFSNLSLRILQKDKIAIVGKNGSGKSSFLKVLLGRISQDGGLLKRGEASIGYFDQHREMLDNDKNLFETFCPNGGDHIEVGGRSIHIFGYLKNFLFPKELLDKKIAYLSGGEKNRIALALLFAKKYDCLILDEPTNDLDIATINILEEYLQNFLGAVIFVSHDRYFIDKIAHKLLVFKGEGVCEESYMSYSEYLEVQKEFQEYEAIQNDLIEAQNAQMLEETRVAQDKKPAKLSYKDTRELEILPDEIEKLEELIKTLETTLSDPRAYENKGIEEIAAHLLETKNLLEKKLERYFVLEEKSQILRK